MSAEYRAELATLKKWIADFHPSSKNYGMYGIRRLDMENKNITTLPPEIKYLIGLKTFYLGNNKFTKLPDEFLELNSLTDLYLGKNHLEYLPRKLAYMKQLRYVHIVNNDKIRIPGHKDPMHFIRLVNKIYIHLLIRKYYYKWRAIIICDRKRLMWEHELYILENHFYTTHC
jgi:Leucine rich repeat